MLGLLLLASAFGAPGDTPAHITVRVSDAQAAYRSCIADRVAARAGGESGEDALAAALERCRDAEITLRRESQAAGGNSAAETLGLVLDTRLEGQEAGLRLREGQ